MEYKKFNHLYSLEIWREYRKEKVKDSLGYTFEQYMKLKYENYKEEIK
jgi:hypothetical protein